MTEDRWLQDLRSLHARSPKNWGIALLLSIFLGVFGADRFYLERFGTGLLKLLTFGGLTIWWYYDIYLIATGKMTDGEGYPVKKPG